MDQAKPAGYYYDEFRFQYNVNLSSYYLTAAPEAVATGNRKPCKDRTNELRVELATRSKEILKRNAEGRTTPAYAAKKDDPAPKFKAPEDQAAWALRHMRFAVPPKKAGDAPLPVHTLFNQVHETLCEEWSQGRDILIKMKSERMRPIGTRKNTPHPGRREPHDDNDYDWRLTDGRVARLSPNALFPECPYSYKFVRYDLGRDPEEACLYIEIFRQRHQDNELEGPYHDDDQGFRSWFETEVDLAWVVEVICASHPQTTGYTGTSTPPLHAQYENACTRSGRVWTHDYSRHEGFSMAPYTEGDVRPSIAEIWTHARLVGVDHGLTRARPVWSGGWDRCAERNRRQIPPMIEHIQCVSPAQAHEWNDRLLEDWKHAGLWIGGYIVETSGRAMSCRTREEADRITRLKSNKKVAAHAEIYPDRAQFLMPLI